MTYKAGLILEGGGMRGVYTAGVLDCFLDNQIELAHCYGVSAGAVNATNYLSKQRGRTFRIILDYINDKRYCSITNLLKTGNMFGVDFLYNRIPNELDPFDYDTFKNNDRHMSVVVSNVQTGKPEYKKLLDLKKEMGWLQASCSLPLISKIVELDGGKYLDGGITDSIPLAKAMADGYKKNIVILTQHRDYQKHQEGKTSLLGSLFYRKYPKTLAAAKQRHLIYNKQLEFIKQQEAHGNIFVLAPDSPIAIKRIEKNKESLFALYQQGYKDATEHLDEVLKFLQQE